MERGRRQPLQVPTLAELTHHTRAAGSNDVTRILPPTSELHVDLPIRSNLLIVHILIRDWLLLLDICLTSVIVVRMSAAATCRRITSPTPNSSMMINVGGAASITFNELTDRLPRSPLRQTLVSHTTQRWCTSWEGYLMFTLEYSCIRDRFDTVWAIIQRT